MSMEKDFAFLAGEYDKPKVLITGITGQDGSYLSELLLERKYEVHGVIRRASLVNTDRIDENFDPESRDFLHYGDLSDQSIVELIYKIKPDWVINLGAMSHVRVSFDIPEYTGDVTGLGVCRLLEGIRRGIENGILSPGIKYYQASSSEMFGMTPPPQKEDTVFNPVSPYGCAKLYGYHMTRGYRMGYNMFASNGILFNHECISPNNIITIQKNNKIKICYVKDLKKQHAGYSVQTTDFTNKNIKILTSDGFKKIKTLTIRSNNSINDKTMRSIETRQGEITVTNEHNCLNSKNKKIKAKDLNDDELKTSAFQLQGSMSVNEDLAKFLGYMVADGHISDKIIYTKNDDILRSKVKKLFNKLFLGESIECEGVSGYSNNKVKKLVFNGINKETKLYLQSLIYNTDKTKKVPEIILNADKKTLLAFFDAYYEGDGTKAGKTTYKYKCVKTNSPILMQGLYYIINTLFSTDTCLYVNKYQNKSFYTLNISSPIKNNKGRHLRKPKNIIYKNYEVEEERWVYDIETENGEFQLGVGNIVVANSPRRGVRFVTRKIVRAAVRIKLRLQDKLELGNLDALRDWGHSKDYMRAIIMILEHDKPDDFVVSTGEYFSVKDFVIKVFGVLDLDWEQYVKYNKSLTRPNEVPALLGDSTKIRETLGWKPEYDFEALVKDMIDSEMEIQKKELK